MPQQVTIFSPRLNELTLSWHLRPTQTMPYSLAKGLVHEVCVVDPDDALVLLKQALLSRATFLFYTSDVQTQRPVGDKTA